MVLNCYNRSMLYALLAKNVGSLIFAFCSHDCTTAAILTGATCIQAAPNFNVCMETLQTLFVGVVARDYKQSYAIAISFLKYYLSQVFKNEVNIATSKKCSFSH